MKRALKKTCLVFLDGTGLLLLLGSLLVALVAVLLVISALVLSPDKVSRALQAVLAEL